jgi:hypothetical protein
MAGRIPKTEDVCSSEMSLWVPTKCPLAFGGIQNVIAQVLETACTLEHTIMLHFLCDCKHVYT